MMEVRDDEMLYAGGEGIVYKRKRNLYFLNFRKYSYHWLYLLNGV